MTIALIIALIVASALLLAAAVLVLCYVYQHVNYRPDMMTDITGEGLSSIEGYKSHE